MLSKEKERRLAIALALGFMAAATNRDEAQEWAQEAFRRGATPRQLADGWLAYERAESGRVQVIHSTPTEEAPDARH